MTVVYTISAFAQTLSHIQQQNIYIYFLNFIINPIYFDFHIHHPPRMWCYVTHLHLFHIPHSAVTKISIQNPLKALQAWHKPPLWWLFTSICNVLNLYFMKEGDVQKVGISKALTAALEPTLLCLLLEVPLEQATRTVFFIWTWVEIKQSTLCLKK